MSNIVELAKTVERALDAYNRARAVLLSALATEGGGRAKAAPGTRAPRGGRNGGPSVAQQVLDRIVASPAGLSRAELVAELGHEGAIHSALKKHSSMKKIAGRDGKWVAVGSETPKPAKGKKG